jgi:RNA polymerase sigma factor (sigma-70 family)
MAFEQHIASTDEDLIESLHQNTLLKRKAEDTIFTRYTYFIKEGMHKYALQEEDAFDAYSDAVLQAINNVVNGTFEQKSSLKTYLYRIFTNKCVDLIRKKTTNKNSIHQTSALTDLLFMIADSAKTVVQQLVEKADMDMLKSKMNELGDGCRQLLALFADSYTDKEIALAMDYKSADVVKTSRLRCLEKLRRLYLDK